MPSRSLSAPARTSLIVSTLCERDEPRLSCVSATMRLRCPRRSTASASGSEATSTSRRPCTYTLPSRCVISRSTRGLPEALALALEIEVTLLLWW
jgi:hypothetical protein